MKCFYYRNYYTIPILLIEFLKFLYHRLYAVIEVASSSGAASVKARLDIEMKHFLPRSCQCEADTRRYRRETASPLLTGREYRDKSAAEFAAVFHWRAFACKQDR